MAAAVFLPSLSSAAGSRLEFGKAVELPSAGFSLKLMPDAKEQPLPSPTTYTYLLTQGDTSQKIEMYSPAELWRLQQYEGRWIDRGGNSFALASIERQLPQGFPRQHATREKIEERLKFEYLTPGKWDQSTLLKWVRDFTGIPGATAHSLKDKPPRMTAVIRIDFPANSRRIGYAFQFNRRYIGQSRAPMNWYFADFMLAAATNPETARKAIMDKCLASAVPRYWAYRTKDKAAAFQDKRFRSSSNTSPSMESSRKQVEDSIRNMRGWWHVHTDHYIILSNLDGRSRTMIKQVQREIERLRGVFEKLIPSSGDVTEVSVLRAFSTESEYEEYVGSRYKWSSGVWMPHLRELVIRPLAGDSSRDRRERVIRTIYHEAFHQYLHYALDRAETSAWYNEGHAVFFENANLDSSFRVTFDDDDYKAERLKNLANKNSLDIESLLNMTYQEFYDRDPEKRIENYSLAWGLVYYLRKAALVERRTPYAGILDRYAQNVVETEDSKKATKHAFDGIQMDTFRKDFTSFWTSSRRRSAAARNKIMRRHR